MSRNLPILTLSDRRFSPHFRVPGSNPHNLTVVCEPLREPLNLPSYLPKDDSNHSDSYPSRRRKKKKRQRRKWANNNSRYHWFNNPELVYQPPEKEEHWEDVSDGPFEEGDYEEVEADEGDSRTPEVSLGYKTSRIRYLPYKQVYFFKPKFHCVSRERTIISYLSYHEEDMQSEEAGEDDPVPQQVGEEQKKQDNPPIVLVKKEEEEEKQGSPPIILIGKGEEEKQDILPIISVKKEEEEQPDNLPMISVKKEEEEQPDNLPILLAEKEEEKQDNLPVILEKEEEELAEASPTDENVSADEMEVIEKSPGEAESSDEAKEKEFMLEIIENDSSDDAEMGDHEEEILEEEEAEEEEKIEEEEEKIEEEEEKIEEEEKVEDSHEAEAVDTSEETPLVKEEVSDVGAAGDPKLGRGAEIILEDSGLHLIGAEYILELRGKHKGSHCTLCADELAPGDVPTEMLTAHTMCYKHMTLYLERHFPSCGFKFIESAQPSKHDVVLQKCQEICRTLGHKRTFVADAPDGCQSSLENIKQCMTSSQSDHWTEADMPPAETDMSQEGEKKEVSDSTVPINEGENCEMKEEIVVGTCSEQSTEKAGEEVVQSENASHSEPGMLEPKSDVAELGLDETHDVPQCAAENSKIMNDIENVAVQVSTVKPCKKSFLHAFRTGTRKVSSYRKYRKRNNIVVKPKFVKPAQAVVVKKETDASDTTGATDVAGKTSEAEQVTVKRSVVKENDVKPQESKIKKVEKTDVACIVVDKKAESDSKKRLKKSSQHSKSCPKRMLEKDGHPNMADVPAMKNKASTSLSKMKGNLLKKKVVPKWTRISKHNENSNSDLPKVADSMSSDRTVMKPKSMNKQNEHYPRNPELRIRKSSAHRQSRSPIRRHQVRSLMGHHSQSIERRYFTKPTFHREAFRISRSPIKRYSRRRSRSPPRIRSRSPPRIRSRSPPRIRSRSPLRRRSRSPLRRESKSPIRRYSRTPERRHSRSPFRHVRKSPVRRHSRSPARRYSRSPKYRRHSRSPFDRYSKRSPRSYSKSPRRRYSRSPTSSGQYSRSPARGARSPVFRYNESRSSEFRKRSFSPAKQEKVRSDRANVSDLDSISDDESLYSGAVEKRAEAPDPRQFPAGPSLGMLQHLPMTNVNAGDASFQQMISFMNAQGTQPQHLGLGGGMATTQTALSMNTLQQELLSNLAFPQPVPAVPFPQSNPNFATVSYPEPKYLQSGSQLFTSPTAFLGAKQHAAFQAPVNPQNFPGLFTNPFQEQASAAKPNEGLFKDMRNIVNKLFGQNANPNESGKSAGANYASLETSKQGISPRGQSVGGSEKKSPVAVPPPDARVSFCDAPRTPSKGNLFPVVSRAEEPPRVVNRVKKSLAQRLASVLIKVGMVDVPEHLIQEMLTKIGAFRTCPPHDVTESEIYIILQRLGYLPRR